MKTTNLLQAFYVLLISSFGTPAFAEEIEENNNESFTTDQLFVIGSGVWSGWDDKNAAVMLQDTNDPTIFVYTGWFTANEDFKFMTQPAWGNEEYRNAGDILDGQGQLILAKGNDNDTKFTLSESGNYKITCNLTSLTITAEKIISHDSPIYHNALYIIGDATSGGWSINDAVDMIQDRDNPFLFVVDADLMIGDFKIVVNKFSGDFGQKTYFRDIDDVTKITDDISLGDNKWDIPMNGNYTITVNLLDESINIIRNGESGLDMLKLSDIRINNLSEKIFRVNGAEGMEMTIYNITGQDITTFKNISAMQIVDMTAHDIGVYIINIRNGKRIKSFKLINK